ncbi:olfactory receptor-like protein OLF4 [Ursus americanus]|uniref:olfactory receptor-like protein OLF4 n=1 Tax=Ursus americanus TaxID=9643 RepID=UPI001E67BD99|nr:olfactory receptor-like protein OLF4 [Ursus americanus]
METVPNEKTWGAVNISSAVERQHLEPWTRQDMVVAFGFLSLAGGPMLHCFLLSHLGTKLWSPLSTIKGEIGTLTWRLSFYIPHPVTSVEPGNDTHISEFLLLGFSEKPELQPLLFGLFLSMYLITVLGNLLLILAVSSDSHLHTPMYFFLANLSFVDICFTSTTVPKMLWNIQTQSQEITYEGCLSQIFFFSVFGCLDNLLLSVMAYDRFMAICHPLHYMVIINPQLCGLLVLVSWIISVLNSSLQSSMLLRLSFRTEVEIPHFFCELNQIIQLACSDPFLNDVLMYFVIVLLVGAPLAGILYSYSKIVSSICRISSAQGKYKAFSTCASHLSVISLFFCTSLGVYLSSAAPQSSHASAVVSVMYTVVTPMLNPFIYSLRNTDIKRALKGILGDPVM